MKTSICQKQAITRRALSALLLALLLILSGSACTQEPPAATTQTNATTTTPSPSTPSPTDPTPVQMRPAQELRIVDFNVLCNKDSAEERSKTMIPLILSYEPDSFGVQESIGIWRTAFKEKLGDLYDSVGLDFGGSAEPTSQFSTDIYYRKDRYKALDWGTFWLSTTPNTPSKFSNTVDCQRTCTWVILEDLQTGFRYVHMNTHLDWMDASVNVVQSQMIRNQILRFSEMGYPVLATGDYNTPQDSISYGQILSGGFVSDSKFVAEKTMDIPTHSSQEKPIDFCFVTADKMTVREYAVINNVSNGVTVSDHKGIFVHALVHSLPDQDALTSAPAFKEEVSIQAKVTRAGTIELTMPQATDANGTYAVDYFVQLHASDGTLLLEKTIGSGIFLPLVSPTVTFHLNVGSYETDYQITVTPRAMLNVVGESITATVHCDSSISGAAPDAPLLLHVQVQNGKAVDLSPNSFAIETIGTVDLSNQTMQFNGTGNLKVAGMGTQYTALSNGFSMELKIKTGEDILTGVDICSNKHAGGYGISIGGGMLRFGMYFNNGYQYISSPIEPNTEYHVIAVYNGARMYLYVNGAYVCEYSTHSAEWGLPTVEGARYLCIGAETDAKGMGEYPFTGTVTYVRIYSAPLNDANVIYLFQNQ